MFNQRLFKLTVLAIIVLLAAATAIPWRSLAASASGAPPPGNLQYQMVNAYQFRPYIPVSTGYYFNDELANPGPEGMFYQAALTLPDNITIRKMVVYFNDNSEQDLVVALWRFDPSTGSHLEMATVTSAGAQDQYLTAADQSIIEPAVNQKSYSYYIEVGMPPAGSALRVAAVRIDYNNRGIQQQDQNTP